MSAPNTPPQNPHGGPPSSGSTPKTERFLFPRWSNLAPTLGAVLAILGGSAAIGALWYYAPSKFFEVGYTPIQPVEYSHKLHAGDLGLDCRYCHFTVESSGFAAVPPGQVCMNCHTKVKSDSPEIQKVVEAFKADRPVEWVKVHNLPDYVYFNHSAHVGAGVGCASCHGRVDQMIRVSQVKPLSMGWCLDCHRDPGSSLRDPKDITNMAWQAPEAGSGVEVAAITKDTGRKVNPPVHCSGCHR